MGEYYTGPDKRLVQGTSGRGALFVTVSGRLVTRKWSDFPAKFRVQPEVFEGVFLSFPAIMKFAFESFAF